MVNCCIYDEKLIYATHWTDTDNKITDVLEKDKMAGIFYVIYGINDWMFFFYFSCLFYKCSQKRYKISKQYPNI
jgi:hypothetical protein